MVDPSSGPDGPSQRPLGRGFWIAVFLPIAMFLTGLLLMVARGSLGNLGFLLVQLSSGVAVGSTIVCTMMIGSRSGVIMGIVTLVGLGFLYTAIALAGCAPFFSGL
jgi:hypothetical protein